jgi:hypothetical protein
MTETVGLPYWTRSTAFVELLPGVPMFRRPFSTAKVCRGAPRHRRARERRRWIPTAGRSRRGPSGGAAEESRSKPQPTPHPSPAPGSRLIRISGAGSGPPQRWPGRSPAAVAIVRVVAADTTASFFGVLGVVAVAPWNVAVVLGHLSGLLLSPAIALVGVVVAAVALCVVSLPLGPELWPAWARTMVGYRTFIADATPPLEAGDPLCAPAIRHRARGIGPPGHGPLDRARGLADGRGRLALVPAWPSRSGAVRPKLPRLIGVTLLAILVAGPVPGAS